jgi:Kef-type K+ transport system membrane component KefB
MSLTQTLLIQFLLVVPLPFVVASALGSRRVVPLAVVQVLIGIALGPSLFGRLFPGLSGIIFRPDSLAPLTGLASIAVLLFSFVTGLHLDLSRLRGRTSALCVIATSSLLIPFVAGYAGGAWIAGWEATAGAHPIAFAVTIGICTSVTAMPVLGAILREMDLLADHVGQIALSLAAINDAVLWVALTLLLTVTGISGGSSARLLLLPVYFATMFWLVRPVLARVAGRMLVDGQLKDSALAIVGGVAIASALSAEMMGIEFILGAFVAGVIMPPALRKPTLLRLESVTMTLLMPFFFTLTGLKTFIDLGSSGFLEVFLLTTTLAITSKLLGTTCAARWVGEPWPVAIGLGSLMQTKGLMEVIILTIFRSAGLISGEIFSALILMSLVCTALTMPVTAIALSRRTAVLDRAGA